MTEDPGDDGGTERRPRAPDEPHPATPYLVMLALATIIGAALTVYVWLNRDEIVQILTQSPT